MEKSPRRLEDAIELALLGHRYQLDKQGQPYILHVLRVMLHFRELEYQMVAALHDVIEDTTVTLKDLIDAEFPPEVVVAVDALTRRKDETYEGYIRRLSQNKLATAVKLKDLDDNLERMTPELESLRTRYMHALEIIGNARLEHGWFV